MNRSVSTAAVFLVLSYACLVDPGASQSTDPPFPNADPLPVDQEVTWFIALTYAKRANVTEEQARQASDLKSFATPSSVDVVLLHLNPSEEEWLLDDTALPEPKVRDFVLSLTDDELSELVRLVGSNLSGEAYRTSLLEATDEVQGKSILRAVTGKPGEGGTFYYYDLHRPYLDFTTLEWVDATRIRVVHLPFDPR